MDKIRVIFVLPEDCIEAAQAPTIMLRAYKYCKQACMNVSWVNAKSSTQMRFSKSDLVVFDEFESETFETVRKIGSSRILSAWCLALCFVYDHPIPNLPWPVYTNAMAGCVISSTNIVRAKEWNIAQRVKLMGGRYTEDLTSTTHLVTESVTSEKYYDAGARGLKIMVSQWIEAVWLKSRTQNTHCDNNRFRRFRCLPFHNLIIELTGFPTLGMRKEVVKNVINNGGAFTGNLIYPPDVLVVYGELGIASEMYQLAETNPHIQCVNLNWITDSISKGYAQPFHLYAVAGKEASTSASERILSTKRKSTSEEMQILSIGVKIKKPKKDGEYLNESSVSPSGCILGTQQASNFDSHGKRCSPVKKTECLEKARSGKKSVDENANTLISDFNWLDAVLYTEDTLIRNRVTFKNAFFSGLSFILTDVPRELYNDIKQKIGDRSGRVVQKTDWCVPDFIVTPIVVKAPSTTMAIHSVNVLYIFDCIEQCKKLPVAYYHRPFVVNNFEPLKNCVVTVNGYKNNERIFLTALIKALGGVSQEQLAQVSLTEENLRACTHLLSLKSSGEKYEAALKWNIPVVAKEWLLECGNTGKLVPVQKFLMGDSKVKTPVTGPFAKASPALKPVAVAKTPTNKLTDYKISTFLET